MGVLLIKCPATGHQFSTGIQVGGDTVAAGAAGVHPHSPYCRVEHSWLPREAKLVEAIPPGDWIENQNRR